LKESLLKTLTPGDLESCNSADSFLQSGFWGSFKARFGWNARPFLAEWNVHGDEDPAAASRPLLVIRRRLAPFVSFAYIPWGPELPAGLRADERGQALEELAAALKNYLPIDTVFARFDPPWLIETPDEGGPPPSFLKASAGVQPPDTVIIDLNRTDEAILTGMKPKWRYNARLALKKGVRIKQADEDGLEDFYALLQETSRRDGIAIHDIAYYKTLFSHCREYQTRNADKTPKVPRPDLRLYLAVHEGDILAGIVTFFLGARATYLYGASSDKKRNAMAAYALQLNAIKEAKRAGCLCYDLFGIPPDSNPGHPMAGLYQFKTGFGGKIVHRPGSWDYPYRPLLYRLFRAAEAFRKKRRDAKKRK
jgi:lipid II:glycine glycyltransferase (peptidoglycan interpeptide bridge formation enzyme)